MRRRRAELLRDAGTIAPSAALADATADVSIGNPAMLWIAG